MAMLMHSEKMSDDEVKRYREDLDDMSGIVHKIACRSKYHPYGYGFYSPMVRFDPEKGFFAEWSSYDTCE